MIKTHFTMNPNKILYAQEGHIHLNWKGQPPFILRSAQAEDFTHSKLLYNGKENHYFLTGLREGRHFFKITGNQGISDTIVVNVDYPSKNLVIGSLVIGLTLFLTLVAIIILGNKKSEQSSS